MKLNKTLKFIFGIVLFLIILYGVYFFWMNFSNFNRSKYILSRILPTPIAMVGGKIVWITDYDNFFKSKKTGQDYSVELYNQANFDNFLQNLVMKNLRSPGTQNDIQLRIKFYQKTFKASGAEGIYTNVKNGIQNNVSFATLNQEYDQDPYSKAFSGDLGYLESTKLLPEILQTVDTMNTGDIQAIASRYGWHIIQVVDKDQKGEGGSQRFHLKQIFLKADGFEQWLSQETKKIKIYKLINF